MRNFRSVSLTILAMVVYLAPLNRIAANELLIDLSLGNVQTINNDYQHGIAYDYALALSNSGFNYRIGGLSLDEIKPENNSEGAKISIKAIYVEFSKSIEFDVIDLEFGGGVVFSDTRASFSGRNVANEDDTRPMINVKAIKKLGDSFDLLGDWKYIDDLSGGDLSLFQVGVRFQF